jgi:hypothetical protein
MAERIGRFVTKRMWTPIKDAKNSGYPRFSRDDGPMTIAAPAMLRQAFQTEGFVPTGWSGDYVDRRLIK